MAAWRLSNDVEKGGLDVSISSITHPKDHTSAFCQSSLDTASLRMTSGEDHSGVPGVMDAPGVMDVAFGFASSPSCRSRAYRSHAEPKSDSFRVCERPSSSAIRMFPDLMSRWEMPMWWRKERPRRSWRV
jgi:hypothetical protein